MYFLFYIMYCFLYRINGIAAHCYEVFFFIHDPAGQFAYFFGYFD